MPEGETLGPTACWWFEARVEINNVDVIGVIDAQ